MTHECPKSHGHDFVRVARTYRYEPRAFLWFAWIAEVPSGYVVRCTDVACARYWRIGLDGVHVPAGHGEPVQLVPQGEERVEREERAPTEALPLAVRRPRL